MLCLNVVSEIVVSEIDSVTMSAPLSRALLVGLVATKVYSGTGADIVMESISLTT